MTAVSFSPRTNPDPKNIDRADALNELKPRGRVFHEIEGVPRVLALPTPNPGVLIAAPR